METKVLQLPRSSDVGRDFFDAIEEVGRELHENKTSQRYIRSLKIDYAPSCFSFFAQLKAELGGVELHMTMNAARAPGTFEVSAQYGSQALATCVVAPLEVPPLAEEEGGEEKPSDGGETRDQGKA